MPLASSLPRQCCCASSVRRERKHAFCASRTGLETKLRRRVARVQPDVLLKHASTQRRRSRDFVRSYVSFLGGAPMSGVSLINCSLRGRGNLPLDTVSRPISSHLFFP